MARSMLTTIDNPYNPFTQFDEWKAFDEEKGYYTCEYLDRIVKTSDELSDEDNDQDFEDAINEIIAYNLLGIYQKVTIGTFESMKRKPLTEENVESLKLLYNVDDISSIIETIKETNNSSFE